MHAFIATVVVALAIVTGGFTTQAQAKPVQPVASVTVAASTSAVGVLAH